MSSRLLGVGATFIALCACNTPFGFGGEDWGGDTARSPSQGLDTAVDTTPGLSWGASVVASRATCTDAAGTGLFVDVDGGQVWVIHDGFDGACCAEWQVAIGADDADPSHLSATYTNTATDTCACDCGGWEIEYVITGLSDGHYTLDAGDLSVSFDVATP